MQLSGNRTLFDDQLPIEVQAKELERKTAMLHLNEEDEKMLVWLEDEKAKRAEFRRCEMERKQKAEQKRQEYYERMEQIKRMEEERIASTKKKKKGKGKMKK